ncbi:MAG TPA: menaquinone biosynthesis protein [Pyrinomonadaceae bacterium]|jgi:chorismate dehydratase
MKPTRISASSYLNTAPLVWSFLYGEQHGRVEIILDNAPARSAQLLADDRVDAALVPVFAYQTIDGANLIPDVCVGALQRVQSVCLVTHGCELDAVRSVALDSSSRTSVALTKIIFREFLNSEPDWKTAEPDIDAMLAAADCALLIGDPALRLAGHGYKVFDLAALWRKFTGLGFVFAMWMTRRQTSPVDFAAVRDEGLEHIEEIMNNYLPHVSLDRDEMRAYLTQSISYSVDNSMQDGMGLYFELAERHGLIAYNKPPRSTRIQ